MILQFQFILTPSTSKTVCFYILDGLNGSFYLEKTVKLVSYFFKKIVLNLMIPIWKLFESLWTFLGAYLLIEALVIIMISQY